MRQVAGRVFLSVVACALQGACSISIPTQVSTPSFSPGGPSEWTVDFTRSGGFAGRTVSLHLLSSGALTASEPESGTTVQSEISSEEAAQIGQLLQGALPFLVERRAQSCPDCFTYTLGVEIDGQTYAGQATDVDMGGLEPLIRALSALVGRALSGQP